MYGVRIQKNIFSVKLIIIWYTIFSCSRFWIQLFYLGYNCTAQDGHFLNYNEKDYINENEVCHCLDRETDGTIVCEPVQTPTKYVPIFLYIVYYTTEFK